ncbi:MAG: EAL domain-containing protein [Hyphomicrobiales bacterium]|nr:EAL domain-containing protein [Hyphomicrobiales bacterium]
MEDNRIILRRRLERKNIEVLEVDNGLAALDLIAAEPVDLVLLDVMMAGIDGIEVLRRIRLRYSRDELPVIMVTARTDAADIAEALGLGANDYVTKPVDMRIAFARIEVQLDRMRAQRALQASLQRLEEINRYLEDEILNRKLADERRDYLAYHDPLTELGNWAQLRNRLDTALRRAEHEGNISALLMVDLCDFKAINESHGHTAGDALLVNAGLRLKSVLRESDLAARVGSNRFAVLLNGLRAVEDVEHVADRIFEMFSEPFFFGGHSIALELCAGIALAPDDGVEPDLILENVNLALAQARREGAGARCFFEQDMNRLARQKRSLKQDLSKALAGHQFELYYQPLFHLTHKSVTGYEALLRWHHPERGLVSPADFIPVAEETGLIVTIGEWVLREACRTAAAWSNGAKIAVNVSVIQLCEPGFVGKVMQALSESGLPPHRLELEITESVLMDKADELLDVLKALRERGVRLSLDDFGTGYSSLSYIQAFPFSKLKIDQSFVQRFGVDKSSEPIVHTILELARTLGIETIAEGIETRDQFECLERLGCDEVQGYLISKPMPLRDVQKLMKRIQPKVA